MRVCASSSAFPVWLADEIRHVLLYEDDKLTKVNAMLHGAYDCWARKMGKTERQF